MAAKDVIGQFLENRQEYLNDVVKPLQNKRETIYAVAGTDAVAYARRRFPNKSIKLIRSGLTPTSIEGFLYGLRIVFQPSQAKGLDATYQFRFTGKEKREATVSVKNQRVEVTEGLVGKPDLQVTADGATWLKFLSNRSFLAWGLITGRIKLHGRPNLLIKFGHCFVS